jgi:hypothetical protein
MATTISTATLTVDIVEDLTLDGRQIGKTTSKAITGINQAPGAIVTVPFATNGLVLFQLFTAASFGQYVGSEVKYCRITNKDGLNFVTLFFKTLGSTKGYAVKLEAGRSFIWWADQMDTDPTSIDIDNVTFEDIAIVVAKADTADCEVEFLLALAS